MARVKRGVTAHAKHKKTLKLASGYYGRRKNTFRVAQQAVDKAGQYAYRDRKAKKRVFRALWIEIDRKVLSDIAIREPAAFAALVERARQAIA